MLPTQFIISKDSPHQLIQKIIQRKIAFILFLSQTIILISRFEGLIPPTWARKQLLSHEGFPKTTLLSRRMSPFTALRRTPDVNDNSADLSHVEGLPPRLACDTAVQGTLPYFLSTHASLVFCQPVSSVPVDTGR